MISLHIRDTIWWRWHGFKFHHILQILEWQLSTPLRMEAFVNDWISLPLFFNLEPPLVVMVMSRRVSVHSWMNCAFMNCECFMFTRMSEISLSNWRFLFVCSLIQTSSKCQPSFPRSPSLQTCVFSGRSHGRCWFPECVAALCSTQKSYCPASFIRSELAGREPSQIVAELIEKGWRETFSCLAL